MFGFKKKEKVDNKQIQENIKVANNPTHNIANAQTIANKNVKQPKVVNKPKDNKPTKPKKVSTLEMYDTLLSEILTNNYLFRPPEKVDSNDKISLSWGREDTSSTMTKAFIIEGFPNWIEDNILQKITNFVTLNSSRVKYNYFLDLAPHTIDWESSDMQAMIKRWGNRIKNSEIDENDVFTQRENAGEINLLRNKQNTFKYFNDADLSADRRTLFKGTCYIEISGSVDNVPEYEQALQNFKTICSIYRINFTECKADIYDWRRSQLPTSRRDIEALKNKIPTQVMTDDSVSILLSNYQGKIGKKGVLMGVDVYSSLPVFHVFREDKMQAENVLISAFTGGGKSFYLKSLLPWLLNENMSLCILDYEGDEYTKFAKFVNDGKEGEAIIVDMNASSGTYFEPLIIADPTGNEELDRRAKQSSTEFASAMIKILLGGEVNDLEKYLISKIITDIYDNNGITDNPKTWAKSKELRIPMFYDRLSNYIERREGVDPSGDDDLHKVAKLMQLKLRRFFVEGESEYGTFRTVLKLEDIRDARVVIFSFGNNGADTQGADQTKVALKQLSVSKITNEISNYNWYVKNQKFTVKVWEEVQRFVNIKGAEDIMLNCITGGRKRGDITFIVTNNLASILDAESDFTKALKSNLTGYCVGYLPDEDTRAKFCNIFGLQLLRGDLDKIFEENSNNTTKDAKGNVVESPFKNAFLIKFNSTSKSPEVKTIVKAMVHPEVADLKIF